MKKNTALKKTLITVVLLLVFYGCSLILENSSYSYLLTDLQKLYHVILSEAASTAGSDESNPSSEDVISSADNSQVSGTLAVHFIDVGQADSILVVQGDEAMLIDGGNGGDKATISSYIRSLGISRLKYVIGTHPHEDHIGSLSHIVNSFDIEKVYFPKVTANTRVFENFVNSVTSKGLSLTVPKVNSSFYVGEAKCTILAPNSTSYSNTNDYSIVLKLEYGSTSFLLTGDAEIPSENEILSKNLDISATVLKLGHHGSKSSTGEAFLKAVNPTYAVVSVGADNKYNLPNIEVMSMLKKHNIKVFRTDESGTIIAVSNGKNITFNVKPGSYSGMIK